MEESTSAMAGVGIIIGLCIVAIAFAGAWHIYGLKGALLVCFILGPLTFIVSLTGYVPIAGPFLFWWLHKAYILPNFLQWFPEISPSWVTALYFWSGLIATIGYTIMSCGVIATATADEI